MEFLVDVGREGVLNSSNFALLGADDEPFQTALRLERADLLEFANQEADELPPAFFY